VNFNTYGLLKKVKVLYYVTISISRRVLLYLKVFRLQSLVFNKSGVEMKMNVGHR
jgi:hypothetical protein